METLPAHPVDAALGGTFMRDIMKANPDGSPVTAPLAEVFHMD